MKFICYGCEEFHNDPCILDVGEEQYVSGEQMRCPFNNAERDRHYCKWEKYDDSKVANLQPEVAKLQKLTDEVFNRPDCPEWANYAAVDKDGTARFHADEPIVPTMLDGEWWCSIGNDSLIDGKFDATDWQNSLIERPTAKLPDWCKVGEWCYCLDDDGKCKYFKITKIKDNYIYGEDWDIDYHHIRQARLRPYNAGEMRGLVGKVIERNSSAYLVYSFAHDDLETTVSIEGKYLSENTLLKDFTIDGKPCGVLEHLENGEWVK